MAMQEYQTTVQITVKKIIIAVNADAPKSCALICAFFQGRQPTHGGPPTADCTRYDLSPAWVKKQPPEKSYFRRLNACQNEFGTAVKSTTPPVYPPAQPGGEGPGSQPPKKPPQ